MPDIYLHDHEDFKALLEAVSIEKGIGAPSLVEKDYWIMHVLWGLKKEDLEFELKGGTSLSKGYGIIDRFSEDIDIKIIPPSEMKVSTKNTQTKKNQVESRRIYFDWLAEQISIPGILDVVRDKEFDDKYFRSAGIRLHYDTKFEPIPDLKAGILLEVGFDKTQPNDNLDISSWANDFGADKVPSLIDNRAVGIACYHPEYTFVEKVQAVVKKYRQYKKSGEFSTNFLRHYYDIYMLLGCERVIKFIGTPEYEEHKKDRIRGDDRDFGIPPAFDILNSDFENQYAKTAGIYYRGQIPLKEIVERIQLHLDKL